MRFLIDLVMLVSYVSARMYRNLLLFSDFSLVITVSFVLQTMQLKFQRYAYIQNEHVVRIDVGTQ